MYTLTEREIVEYIDGLFKEEVSPQKDLLQQAKEASILEIYTVQEVNAYPSKHIASIELKYTCERYVRQFVVGTIY